MKFIIIKKEISFYPIVNIVYKMNTDMPKAKNNHSHQHPFTLNIEKGMNDKILIGQIAEIPNIIVQGENKTELKKIALTAIKGYFQAFPDKHDKIFHRQKGKIEREEIILKL